MKSKQKKKTKCSTCNDWGFIRDMMPWGMPVPYVDRPCPKKCGGRRLPSDIYEEAKIYES